MTSEVTQAALKPCPWCGTAEHLSVQWPGSMTADMPDCRCRVVCTHIDHDTVVGPTAYGKFAAATAWNTRLTTQSGEGRSGAGEDWVSHDGGDCPVDPAATVEIKLRDGSVTTMTAKAVTWRYGTYIFEAHRTMPASCEVVAYRLAALNARQSGEGEREKFLTAYVSEDSKIIGIEHDTDADWHKLHDAHIALWNRLEERIREREKCPRKPALRATDDAGGA